MTDLIAQIDDLTYKLECAHARIEELEGALGANYGLPLCFGLTPIQARLLSFLMVKKVALKEAIYNALYSDIICDKDLPTTKNLDIQICLIRKKLRCFGIEIETLWGIGYSLSLENKDKINRLLDQEAGKVAA